MNLFLWIIIFAGIGVLLIFVWRRRGQSLSKKGNQAKAARKEKAKADILTFIQKRGRVTNDQAQKLLGVSDATATRLLEELQRDGKVAQRGETGKGVFYTSVM